MANQQKKSFDFINEVGRLEGDMEKPVMVSQGDLMKDLDIGAANRADGTFINEYTGKDKTSLSEIIFSE